MRILFNSRKQLYKTPYGTVRPGQFCTFRIHVPESLRASQVILHLEYMAGEPYSEYRFVRETSAPERYESFTGTFSIGRCGLYYYYFIIEAESGSFRLFRQGDDTNMEAGDRWQISCVPERYAPDWMQGIMYQAFPDRFAKSGECDCSEKLRPYKVHERWDEQPAYLPDENGEVLCNDFFGGNFRGITEKLPYLKSLGVTVLYLNPIGMAFSNHRYDTADYKRPDPMLGTEEDFRDLCEEAHRRNIRVILDGVYSHTGANSRYFDKLGIFGNGAYHGKTSPYYPWYTFRHFPDDYACWWNFPTLPEVRETNDAFLNYIIRDSDSVMAHWLRLGADGFRLDVADELPDAFLSLFRAHLRELSPEAILIGEVWEDASNKVAYGEERHYFTDDQLDGVMNYPWRQAIIGFCRGEDDGSGFRESVETLSENYPPEVLQRMMNPLGTHDTPRILTELCGRFEGSREQMAAYRLTPEQRTLAGKRLRMASFLQYALPGVPSIFYGDEAGMEGCRDPFCRGTFPWGREDAALQDYFRALASFRAHPAIRHGLVRTICGGEGRVGFYRFCDGQTAAVFANLSGEPWELPVAGRTILSSEEQGEDVRILSPGAFCALETDAAPQL